MPLALLLNTYLTAEILLPSLAAFFILNVILLLGQIVPLLDIILNFGIGGADFIRLVAYLCPNLFLFSLPMAGTIGIILAFSRLAGDGEIMALKASGISTFRLLPPVMLIALAVCLLTGWAAANLAPASATATKGLLFRLAKEKFDKGMRARQFSEGTGSFVLYVDRIDKPSATWKGIYLADVSDPRHPVTIVASQGRFTADTASLTIRLDLEDGSIHRQSGATTQTIAFASYRLTIPITPPAMVAGGSTAVTVTGKHEMTMAQLLENGRRLGEDSDRGGALIAEFHKRLVIPVGAFFLCLTGLPLGLLSRPGSRALGLPIGLVLFLGFYVAISAAKAVGESGLLPPAVALWGVDVAYGLLCFLLLRLAGGESLDRLSDRLNNLIVSCTNLLRRRRGAHAA